MLDRRDIRTQVRTRRRSLPHALQQQAALAARDRFLTHLPTLTQKQDPRIGLYLSNDGELDTKVLIQALWLRNIPLYLPKLHPFTPGQLLFIRYAADTQMQPNRYGIPEPKLDVRQILPVQHLDILITPLVAFDHQGNRMGMGKGYYDRTLVQWLNTGRPLPIGYAHDCQQVNALPCQSWDVPLPMVVTPAKLHSFNR